MEENETETKREFRVKGRNSHEIECKKMREKKETCEFKVGLQKKKVKHMDKRGKGGEKRIETDK